MTDTRGVTPVLLCAGKGEALWFFGGLLTFKATSEQTGGELVVAEQLFPQGTATPLHVQRGEATSFYVLEGRITFVVGDTTQAAGKGAFVYVPLDVPHAFRVESETVRLLNVTTPQHEQFFRAAGVHAPANTLPPPGDPRGAIDLERGFAPRQSDLASRSSARRRRRRDRIHSGRLPSPGMTLRAEMRHKEPTMASIGRQEPNPLAEQKATLIHAADIPELDRGGVAMSPLATSALGATEALVLRGRVAPGLEFPAHSHDRQEILVFLSGSAQSTIGEDEHRIEAGDVVIIPPGTVHSFAALGGDTLEAIGITPSGTHTYLPSGEELKLHGEHEERRVDMPPRRWSSR
jgi:quercetin dioxygenase-like cupin family protein